MEHKIKLEFPDGSSKEYEKGITGEHIAKGISEGLARKAICVKVNDKLQELKAPIESSGKFKIITFNDDEGKNTFRHSSAHLMAQAIQRLFPDAKLTIGPVVEEGFYYDIDHEPFKPEDLAKIEEEMKKIVKEDLEIKRREISTKEALELFKNNSYKQEIIKNIEEFGEGSVEQSSPTFHSRESHTDKSDTVSVYTQGEFSDLCRGPHLPRTGMIKAFKLTKTAGAYWRGDVKNKQLQRIYGVSFPDKKELEEYLQRLEEAEKRDHRKLGKEMDLFVFSELVGSGLPLWTPKGTLLRNLLDEYIWTLRREKGYKQVTIPHITKKYLYETSGHWAKYSD
ncbi:MAG: TGS domain-containing protein, partial [Candidatus Nanoarchaeia archaeon]